MLITGVLKIQILRERSRSKYWRLFHFPLCPDINNNRVWGSGSAGLMYLPSIIIPEVALIKIDFCPCVVHLLTNRKVTRAPFEH